jgi:hypothetical protein
MAKKFPKLDLPMSELIRLYAEDKLWIVHNADTFEPYFMLPDTRKMYHGDDTEFWDYLSLIVRENTKHVAMRGMKV